MDPHRLASELGVPIEQAEMAIEAWSEQDDASALSYNIEGISGACEESLLGTRLGDSFLHRLRRKTRDCWGCVDLCDIHLLPHKSQAVVAGVITDLRYKTSSGGKEMMFIMLRDATATFEVVAFTKQCQAFANELILGHLVALDCNVSHRASVQRKHEDAGDSEEITERPSGVMIGLALERAFLIGAL
jgi:DNA polymerase III alpha subunit